MNIDESIYTLNIFDMYDDLIMPEPVKVEVEIVLAVMKFPNSMKMLSDQHIWVGDTAASVHTSPHDNGMIPETKSRTSETITVGKVDSEKMVKYRSVSRTVCHKHGCMVGRAKLQHVTQSVQTR